jgi:uncharacterized DUF497 family protein
MKIIWDTDKNKTLIKERGVSFDEFAALILEGAYLDILPNPARKNQEMFIVPYNDYTYVVPFVTDNENDCIALKTIFPSRKYHRLYSKKISKILKNSENENSQTNHTGQRGTTD